jgi:hypothetical protein
LPGRSARQEEIFFKVNKCVEEILRYKEGEKVREGRMSIPGYVDYKRREYCKDIKCPVQMELNKHKEGSTEYDEIRKTCRSSCKHTTYEFHHWLIEKGYEIVRPLN